MFYDCLFKLEIGNLQKWLRLSDHMPIFVEIKNNKYEL